ncbi:apolipoprotein C-II [Ascaphus truei]|uniref:apolipoprotein C-II n=1 Tax=Ascaphus truei TaxID=8439 RepID=UPI003F59275B
MNRTHVLAVSLLLLFLGTATESYRIQKREAPTYLSQIQNLMATSWDQVSSKAHELIERAKTTDVEEKIKEIYEKGTSAASTYTTIMYDQMYHWWQGH